jgi:hypothetical protein
VAGTSRGTPPLTVSGDVPVDPPLGDLGGEATALWNAG